jgi:hypothetical protein
MDLLPWKGQWLVLVHTCWFARLAKSIFAYKEKRCQHPCACMRKMCAKTYTKYTYKPLLKINSKNHHPKSSKTMVSMWQFPVCSDVKTPLLQLTEKYDPKWTCCPGGADDWCWCIHGNARLNACVYRPRGQNV